MPRRDFVDSSHLFNNRNFRDDRRLVQFLPNNPDLKITVVNDYAHPSISPGLINNRGRSDLPHAHRGRHVFARPGHFRSNNCTINVSPRGQLHSSIQGRNHIATNEPVFSSAIRNRFTRQPMKPRVPTGHVASSMVKTSSVSQGRQWNYSRPNRSTVDDSQTSFQRPPQGTSYATYSHERGNFRRHPDVFAVPPRPLFPDNSTPKVPVGRNVNNANGHKSANIRDPNSYYYEPRPTSGQPVGELRWVHQPAHGQQFRSIPTTARASRRTRSFRRASNSGRGFSVTYQATNGTEAPVYTSQSFGRQTYESNAAKSNRIAPSDDEYIDDFSPRDLAKFKLEIDMNEFTVTSPTVSDPILTMPLSKWNSNDLCGNDGDDSAAPADFLDSVCLTDEFCDPSLSAMYPQNPNGTNYESDDVIPCSLLPLSWMPILPGDICSAGFVIDHITNGVKLGKTYDYRTGFSKSTLDVHRDSPSTNTMDATSLTRSKSECVISYQPFVQHSILHARQKSLSKSCSMPTLAMSLSLALLSRWNSYPALSN